MDCLKLIASDTDGKEQEFSVQSWLAIDLVIAQGKI